MTDTEKRLGEIEARHARGDVAADIDGESDVTFLLATVRGLEGRCPICASDPEIQGGAAHWMKCEECGIEHATLEDLPETARFIQCHGCIVNAENARLRGALEKQSRLLDLCAGAPAATRDWFPDKMRQIAGDMRKALAGPGGGE